MKLPANISTLALLFKKRRGPEIGEIPSAFLMTVCSLLFVKEEGEGGNPQKKAPLAADVDLLLAQHGSLPPPMHRRPQP